MKQPEKQSLKELIKFALEMPVENRDQYAALFSTGIVPEKMTRGELIALQLLDSASRGSLEAIKELRQWVVEDPKNPTAGNTNYYQFLTVIADGKHPAEAAGLVPGAPEGLRNLVRTIEAKAIEPPQNDLLDDLL